MNRLNRRSFVAALTAAPLGLLAPLALPGRKYVVTVILATGERFVLYPALPRSEFDKIAACANVRYAHAERVWGNVDLQHYRRQGFRLSCWRGDAGAKGGAA